MAVVVCPQRIAAVEKGESYSQAWEVATALGGGVGGGARWRKVPVSSTSGSAPGSTAGSAPGSPDSPPHVLLLPPPRHAPSPAPTLTWSDRYSFPNQRDFRKFPYIYFCIPVRGNVVNKGARTCVAIHLVT